MVYQCERCGAVLAAGTTVCPRCGRKYYRPIPDDAETAAWSDYSPPAIPTWGTRNWRRGAPSGRLLRLLLPLIMLGGILALSGKLLPFEMHNNAGNAAFLRGDFQTANREYSQMIALQPQRLDGYCLRGISEYKAGQWDAAAADDTVAARLSTDSFGRSQMIFNRALVRAKQHRLALAFSDYTESLQECQQSQDTRHQAAEAEVQDEDMRGLAWVYQQQKEYGKSVAESTSLIASGRPHPDDYRLRAEAEDGLGQVAAAMKDDNLALTLDPSVDGYRVLADLEVKHGQNAQAVALYKSVTQNRPGNAAFWGGLGWYEYKAGQYAQAIADDRHAQSLDPGQGWVNTNLGLTYAVSGDRDHTVSAYASALPHLTPNERQAALQDLHDALAKQPNAPVVHMALQQVTTGHAPAGIKIKALPPDTDLTAKSPPVDPAFETVLGTEVAQEGYGVCPPKGYRFSEVAVDTPGSDGEEFDWTGPKNSDGIMPGLEVHITHDDGSLAVRTNSDKMLAQAMQWYITNHLFYSESPVKHCTIHGISFAYCDWSGIGIHTAKRFRGTVYEAVTPYHVIRLSYHDSKASADQTIPLLRASAMTFRER